MIKDQEDRQEYFKIKDKTQVVRFRLNEYEQRLLQAAMRREGWQNISGYIKYQLFGMNSKIEYEKLLKEGTEEELGRVLADGMKNINMILNYIRFRYDKDMTVLYHQEGVDVKKWIAVTNHWHSQTMSLLEDVYFTSRKIAERLKIKLKFGSDDLYAGIDPDKLTKEQLDEIAQKLYEENPSMPSGYLL